MNDTSILDSLSAEARSALALCGITKDAQLARISPAALHRELEQAAEFFPEQLQALPTIEQLQQLFREAAGHGSPDTVTDAPESPAEEPTTGQDAADEQPAQAYRATPKPQPENNGRFISLADAKRDSSKEDPRDFNHAIYCARPLSVYLGAWATIAMVAGCITMAVILFQMLIGIELTFRYTYYAGALVLVMLTYYYFLRRALCSTCRIGIYSFRRYPRHRSAHYIPVLGFTLASALNVIIHRRYRCPSCATPQKLFGRNRHRH